MFRVKCKVADWCEGNDRGYYRKPKEFIYTNKFETEKEAQEFMEKEKAKHTPPQRRTSIYSDYEVIKDLDENFDIYKKDQKYNIIYADKDGKDNEFKFIPEEDMSKPEMIMKCKEANKNFVKLKEIKKLEEGVHKMEKNQNINTLADLIKSRDGEGLDIGDNTIDMIVYFEYDEESNDSFDKCLKTIAEGTKVINVQGDYAIVDLYKYVIDHLNAFTANFNLVIDPADGEDNETIASNIVGGILPGLFSGYTNDSTYNSLNSDLISHKKEETIKDTDFIIYRSTVEGPLYISGPTNTSFNKEEAIKYPTEQEALDALHEYINEVVDPDAVYFKVARLNECLEIKEESFEDNKKFMTGEILGLIDNYIDSDDIPRLFEKMGITQEIYEGDEDIPDGKIQDIIEIGLEWLFDHLQPEDYKRILKNELEMTDEEMELYGVELDESKKVKTESGNYGGLINSSEDQLFGSITNTEVYERLQGIRDYLFDYYKVVKKNPEYYQAESNPEELKVAADKIKEAIEALDRAWEE